MIVECPPLVAVVFPATVVSEGLSLSRSKVFLSTTEAWIAVDTPRGPQVVETVDIASLAVLGSGVYELTKSDGSVVQVKEGGGCGCRSQLRQWTPFSGPLRLGT